MRKGLKKLLSLLIVVMMVIPVLPTSLTQPAEVSAGRIDSCNSSTNKVNYGYAQFFGNTSSVWPDNTGHGNRYYIQTTEILSSSQYNTYKGNMVLEMDICPLASNAQMYDYTSAGYTGFVTFNLSNNTIGLGGQNTSLDTAWQVGEWHHVAFYCIYGTESSPASPGVWGSVIWVDGVQLASPIILGNKAVVSNLWCCGAQNCAIDNIAIYAGAGANGTRGTRLYYEDFNDGVWQKCHSDANPSSENGGIVFGLDSYLGAKYWKWDSGNRYVQMISMGIAENYARWEFDACLPGSSSICSTYGSYGGPIIDTGKIGTGSLSGGSMTTLSYTWNTDWHHVILDGQSGTGTAIWIDNVFIGRVSNAIKAKWCGQPSMNLCIDNLTIGYAGNPKTYVEDFEDGKYQKNDGGNGASVDYSITSHTEPDAWTLDYSPTCTAQGRKHKECSVCHNMRYSYQDALGHAWNSGVITTAATCSATGVKTYTCTRSGCGATYTDTVPIDSTNHNYVATVTAPTCGAAGYTTHTCSRCGDSYTDTPVAATGAHTWNAGSVTTAPTCGAAGIRTKTCTVCGATTTVPEPATGAHSWNTGTITTQPTCTATGTRRKTCNTCGAQQDFTEPALGHNYVDVVTAPTCTEAGYTTHTCSRCGDSYTDTPVDATGHTYGEWVQDTAPTCSAQGTKHRICTVCSNRENGTIAIDPSAHNWVYDAEHSTGASCLVDGTNRYECSYCHTTRDDVITAVGYHTPGEWIILSEATCTVAGSKQQECSVCHALLDTPTAIAALGHDYGSVVTPPTCTAAGYTTHTCSRCADTYTDSNVAALGHDYSIVEVTEPTCTAAGYTTHTCSRCADSYTDTPVAALGHSMASWVIDTAATCSAAGTKHRFCSVCGYRENGVVAIDPEAHNYTFTNTVSPTCTASGYDLYTCTHNAGHTTQMNITVPLGHSWGAWSVITPATSGSAGRRSHTCSRCSTTETEDYYLTSVRVGSASGTRGSSVTVDVVLRDNPGIYAQNFIIYYPEELTLTDAVASSDVYPTSGVTHSSSLAVNPAANSMFSSYFTDAGVSTSGVRAMYWYVENSTLTNTTGDGTLVTLTFAIPTGAYAAAVDYTIGIFGVFAPTDDAVDASNESLANPITYVSGTITAAACSHSYGAWTTVKEPSGLAAGIKQRTCSICGYVDEATIATTGEGVANSST
ncbi:MAG: hypothetical protein IKN38_08930, partial [Clostridia bacterium]|nr:hypothetical protein [Clostridia bacterium]